jgi:hypothetical protein
MLKEALTADAPEQVWQSSSVTELLPELDSEVIEICLGSFLRQQPPGIRATGYVIDSLEAALWAFAKGRDFAEGMLLAVNLGEDADTVGAIYGQLAGAYYGLSGIPQPWLEQLHEREQLLQVAEALIQFSRRA